MRWHHWYTREETHMEPENGPLEFYFPLQMCSGSMVVFQGVLGKQKRHLAACGTKLLKNT